MNIPNQSKHNKRPYFPVILPDGRTKYVRDRPEFRNKLKQNNTSTLCSERR